LVDGRLIDFDSMLHVQTQLTQRALRPIDPERLFHPSQVICNYTDFISGTTSFKRASHKLLMLPYLMYLGGHSSSLSAVSAQLADMSAKTIRYVDKVMYINGISSARWAWMEKQIRRAERALFGSVDTRKSLSGEAVTTRRRFRAYLLMRASRAAFGRRSIWGVCTDARVFRSTQDE
jgi:hypothetical protein